MSTRASHLQQTITADSLAHLYKGEEWHAQLQLIAERLREIYSLPLVAYDAVAQSIARDLVMAPDMDEVARQCDLLIERIQVLLSEPNTSSYVDETEIDPRANASRVMLTL